MTVVKRFDPVVIRERRAKLNTIGRLVDTAHDAAAALLWLDEHARGCNVLGDLFQIQVTVVARATPNAELAEDFLLMAARSFELDILDRAGEMALGQFDITGRK